jgi:hypothetical protein
MDLLEDGANPTDGWVERVGLGVMTRVLDLS